METKYRVKQVGNSYYPQERGLLFWHNLRTYGVSSSDYLEHARPLLFTRCWERQQICNDLCLVVHSYHYDSLEGAVGRIEQYKKIKKPVYYRGHSITITDDGYYVDTSVCAYEGGITLDTYYTL